MIAKLNGAVIMPQESFNTSADGASVSGDVAAPSGDFVAPSREVAARERMGRLHPEMEPRGQGTE
jgi:hypothetical protein